MLVNITGNPKKIEAYNKFLVNFNEENKNDEDFEEVKPIKNFDDVFCPYADWLKILDADEECKDMKRIDDNRTDFTGVYITNNANTHIELEMFTDYEEDKSLYTSNAITPLLMYDYGVCDNASQALDVYDEIVKKSTSKEAEKQMNGEFIIRLMPVFQKYNTDWRWHKWGGYIGEQKPEYEYISDETDIDMVYAFKIYKIIKSDMCKEKQNEENANLILTALGNC